MGPMGYIPDSQRLRNLLATRIEAAWVGDGTPQAVAWHGREAAIHRSGSALMVETQQFGKVAFDGPNKAGEYLFAALFWDHAESRAADVALLDS